MWASPSKIPINTSLTSSGNFINLLSERDSLLLSLVEANNTTKLVIKYIIGLLSIYITHNITIMIGLYIQFFLIVSRIVSEDPTKIFRIYWFPADCLYIKEFPAYSKIK